MTNKYFSLLIVLLFSLVTGQAYAEVRIGYVNTAQVLEKAPQAIAASSKLQAEFASREADLVGQGKKLKSQEEKLKRDGAVMSEENRRKLEREILSLQRDIKRAREEFTEDLNIRRNEEFAKLQREAAQAIVTLAKEEKFDLIVESGVVYASDQVDITKKVIDRLKKAAAANNNK